MNFEPTDEQRQLADALRKFLGNDYGFEQRKAIVASASGMSASAWATLCEMGLGTIAIPDADGGFGGGAADLMAAMEACGEALVVEPLLDHLAASRLLARAGSAAQKATCLPGAMDGSRRLALALLEPGRRYEWLPAGTTARATAGGGWVIDGAKTVVVGAPGAHTLLVSAQTGAPGQGNNSDEAASLFLVPADAAGLALSPCRTVDGQRAADVSFNGVAVPADALLGAAGKALPLIEEAVDFATALLCADAIGAMAYANDATLDYLKTRKQFGVPIGSFQALQHRMVEMVIHTEQARSMAIRAVAAVDDAAAGLIGARERSRIVSAAKIKLADAARQVSQESVQLHGGMGMTEELKVSHTFRRLTTAVQRFGDADHHLERYAALDAA
jgi:alkylation response protein AidB-like acyl-CoA dehydrogenase